MNKRKISVRKIVEFILRSGDIDSRRQSSHTPQEGAKIHRRLQKAAGEDYQKEVFLKIKETLPDKQSLTIEGRADGIFKEELWVVDEIKTSETYFEQLDEGQIDLFFAQGQVYAYIYAKENELTEIQVQLTYFQTTEEIITRQRRTFTFDELTIFFKDLVQEYNKWLVFQEEWQAQRNQSLQALTFPYGEYRKGQRELAVAAYKTLRLQQRLFAEAPTGTGKTISTLFPAFKALGEGYGERIFYLTAKTITRQVALGALEDLAEAGGEAKSVILTAKDKICFLAERNCTPEHCPFAKGYYTKINQALWDILHQETTMSRPVIETYAEKYQVCPFELSLDLSLFCDVIVGDYNYLFDPTVYLRRFFEEPEDDYFFLIDEAHNLVNRSREMYSATISRASLQDFQQQLAKSHQGLQKSLKRTLQEFAKIEKIAEEDDWRYHHQKAPADSLINTLYSLSEVLSEWLLENPNDDSQEKALSCYFGILQFLRISEFYDDHYETTVEITYRDMLIRQFCIEPAPFLQQMLDKGKGSILFSASFSPLDYYQEVLGGGEEALCYRLPSPFEEKQQQILIANYIQTTYQQRQGSLMSIVAALGQMLAAKKGNYMVFFPSYQYLDDTAALFQEIFPNVKVLIQDTLMNESEREAFLAEFVAEPQESLLAFCVLGGIFSEGIDLKGERLIGTAIVGVGLPQMNHEQNLIREYYDEKKSAGFAYAYQLPGMNKVLQAAGRVIRDMADYGVVLLLDQRFATYNYKKLFPLHWQGAQICSNEAELAKNLQNFWQNRIEK
ncbi:Rad3-related DNA helicase [Enterococcus sp. PF1-24]|uniref:ATP-dependent DNA helicase n=1 Tax=unclassified Enterococcus TaxID=2608891 RepID=UPI0024760257|nr:MULTISPECIES: ATP-dependent DNA helicase [unclassified Enterococcus]MDH6365104.1 Rad3-related DNA helicase [Enterococcus sp. PFB1-1]MDH6402205.1 Rad3-related DNA helicase [Enterococcus sp. PF1-24]